MARFIDSDKLICQVQNNDKYGTITKQVFISLLQNSETEDVAPVVHAHWEHKLVPRLGYPVPICSHCGESRRETSDFCPDCGAKMDEEVDDG